MKKIMILTAERTGTGHKSAANAIEIGLNKLEYETMQIDCFTLMGKMGMFLENSYIPVTTKFPLFFYIAFLFTQIFPNFIHFLIYMKSKRKLKKEINKFRPDLIISVHCMFTKSISHFIIKEKLNIPFYINVIDLVKPPKVWFDKNADVLFVPTDEVKENYIKKGIDENKLFVSGFPIRNDIKRRTTPKIIEGKVNILLVNPSVNLRKNIKYLKEVSKLDNVSVSFICGRDERLYRTLIKEQKLGNISKDVKVFGFISNMNEFLNSAHILLTKAGPNMILEGAKSATAIIITGHIQGQENSNYEYVVKNKFGFKCEDPKKIYNKLNEFIKNKELNDCLKNVLNASCNNGSEFIVNYINSQMEKIV